MKTLSPEKVNHLRYLAVKLSKGHKKNTVTIVTFHFIGFIAAADRGKMNEGLFFRFSPNIMCLNYLLKNPNRHEPVRWDPPVGLASPRKFDVGSDQRFRLEKLYR